MSFATMRSEGGLGGGRLKMNVNGSDSSGDQLLDAGSLAVLVEHQRGNTNLKKKPGVASTRTVVPLL